MKRYLVFHWRAGCPVGGMGDLVGHYDTLSEAIKACNSAEVPWDDQLGCSSGHVWDIVDNREVWSTN